MKLPADFKEFIALMISHSVQFVMIGGWAYNLYRNPRATGDIDFLLAANSENESRIRKTLADFGFGATLSDEPMLASSKVIMLGRSPFRIDLLTDISGVTFEEVSTTCQWHDLDGLSVPVISPATLLRNKLAAARPKDLADASELQAWLAKNK